MTSRALSVLPLFVLAGCALPTPWEGTGLDEWAWYACDDLASGVSAAGGGDGFYALPQAGRAKLVGQITPNLGRSAWPLAADTAAVLQRSVDGAAQTWALGADTMAARCTDAGWAGVR